jgi:hypothetical protein
VALPALPFGYHHLSQLDVPHTQNFEIHSKNSGVKNLKIIFENFNKMLDGSNFDKSCLLEISIQNFFRFGKF